MLEMTWIHSMGHECEEDKDLKRLLIVPSSVGSSINSNI